MNLHGVISKKYSKIFLIVLITSLVIASVIGLKEYQKKLPLQAHAATPRTCSPSALPIGAIAGQPAPMWCYADLASGVVTLKNGVNSMVDEFNHGLQFADCCGGYTIFNSLRNIGKAVYWRHNDHWMVDSDGMSSMMRPNQTFTFENGKLIIEADVAASIKGYNDKIWPELDITTASAPTISKKSVRYAYGEFAGHPTLGCKLLGTNRQITCAFMNSSGKTASDESSVYDISSAANAGGTAWKVCNGTDPDTYCRNRFRWEITQTSMTMYVNGSRYLQRFALPPLPGEFMKSKLYVYFSSINLNKPGTAYRFHWDRVAVNPQDITTTPTLIPKALPTSMQIATPEGSIQFSGKGFARIPHANYYNGVKGWTIEAWFKDESKDGKGYNHPARYIITKGDTQTSTEIPYLLGIEANTLFVGTRIESQNKLIYYDLGAHNISFNQWHHVAASFNINNNELVLYLDGLAVLKSTLPANTGKNMQPLYIGKNGNNNFWVGKLDDVRIWDTARTGIEIRNNYQSQLEKADNHLIGNWKFDEAKGKVAKDFSAKRENMNVYMGVWTSDIHFSHE